MFRYKMKKKRFAFTGAILLRLCTLLIILSVLSWDALALSIERAGYVVEPNRVERRIKIGNYLDIPLNITNKGLSSQSSSAR